MVNARSVSFVGDSQVFGYTGATRLYWRDVHESYFREGAVFTYGGGGLGSTAVVDDYVNNGSATPWAADVVCDFGRNNVASTTTIIADLNRVIAKTTSGRVWMFQILPTADGTEDIGTPGRASLDATNAAIVAALGNRAISVLAELQALGNGGTTDNADIARGVVPTSVRVSGDNFHMQRAGNYAKALKAIATMETYGP